MNQFTELHELPHDQARRILAKTAESVGCPWIEAIVLAQSAWHLTNRGLDGIAYLLRYLLLLDGDKSLPRSAITDALPKLLMPLNQPSHRTLSFTGPSAPLLLLPAVGFDMDAKIGKLDSELYTFWDQTMVYSLSEGLRIESPDPFGVYHIDFFDHPVRTATRIPFSDTSGIAFPFVRNTVLPLPDASLQGDRPLDLRSIERQLS